MKFKDWINEPVKTNDIFYSCMDPRGYDKDNYVIPLGCSPSYEQFKNNNNTNILTNHPEVNSELLFYSFGISDRRKAFTGKIWDVDRHINTRATFKNILNKTYKMTKLPSDEYFKNIGKFKFVISPEGNGIDCFRHYETWLSKGIPVIEYNPFIQKKYSTLPILWTRDYREINDSYLADKYNSFLDKDYDFRRLLLTKYNPKIQNRIRTIMDIIKPGFVWIPEFFPDNPNTHPQDIQR